MLPTESSESVLVFFDVLVSCCFVVLKWVPLLSPKMPGPSFTPRKATEHLGSPLKTKRFQCFLPSTCEYIYLSLPFNLPGRSPIIVFIISVALTRWKTKRKNFINFSLVSETMTSWMCKSSYAMNRRIDI